MARRPQKRRRLSAASSATSGTDSTCTVTASPPVMASDPPFAFALIVHDAAADLSCVSCHRALASNACTTGKQSQFIVCPRCRATSCSICSRTCTTVPPSLPPTPLLSFSPSPPGTPLVGPAESRPLSLPHEFQLDPPDETPRAHTQARLGRAENARRRRRKRGDIVDDDDERTVVGAEEEEEDQCSHTKGTGAGADGASSPGCGRTMCKNCCIENVQTGTTSCYDCYGLPSATHDRQSPSISLYSSTNPSMSSLLI